MLVEIKARFDEQANIVWARALERAGAHVAYGLVGLKTHSKLALVVRREGRGLRRYVHIGTGNYNPKTARIYVDLGLLTRRSGARRRRDRALQPAHRALPPDALPQAARGADDAASGPRRADRRRGATASAEHGDGRIVIKCNSIVDPAIIAALYRASAARRADRPHRARHVLGPAGRRGLSARRSACARSSAASSSTRASSSSAAASASVLHRLGRHHGAQPRSARRGARAGQRSSQPGRLRAIVEVMLADDRRAWQLGSDDRWRRVEELVDAAARHRHVRDAHDDVRAGEASAAAS